MPHFELELHAESLQVFPFRRLHWRIVAKQIVHNRIETRSYRDGFRSCVDECRRCFLAGTLAGRLCSIERSISSTPVFRRSMKSSGIWLAMKSCFNGSALAAKTRATLRLFP
jgi:hypothetical protein